MAAEVEEEDDEAVREPDEDSSTSKRRRTGRVRKPKFADGDWVAVGDSAPSSEEDDASEEESREVSAVSSLMAWLTAALACDMPSCLLTQHRTGVLL